MMFAHLSKTLAAGVLSATLALTAITPTTASARISDEDAIAGIISLLLLGAVIHNSRNNDAAPAPAPQPQPEVTRGWRVLPAQCIREVTRRNGNTMRVFGRGCLRNNYNHMNRLPEQCRVRFTAANGNTRQGYRVRCMRNQGFRTNRH